MIVDCSLQLNHGTDDGPECWVRILVEVPDLAPDADDPYGGAQEAVKDLLRPFLNNQTYFGEWEPMIVGVNRARSD